MAYSFYELQHQCQSRWSCLVHEIAYVNSRLKLPHRKIWLHQLFRHRCFLDAVMPSKPICAYTKAILRRAFSFCLNLATKLIVVWQLSEEEVQFASHLRAFLTVNMAKSNGKPFLDMTTYGKFTHFLNRQNWVEYSYNRLNEWLRFLVLKLDLCWLIKESYNHVVFGNVSATFSSTWKYNYVMVIFVLFIKSAPT